ncbi:epoxyqueuosine reductase [Archaeoglobus fulgidus]|jgi:epoxyqueuosine reductase QueG|uniref:Iron-sulfur cluster binding protein n=3 Tax=Archaeoglobus fulgidus TaxID=2234 RepID=O30262_ARCFU|nr:epoxyqueuosine reductase [Archaeoglobus fulgidus]AAB91256.1 iron-sulfur cluster binding protein [Archaeoglobus fulgidus DSM 4304]AIG99377.1 iron-sulfur cluster binding protein, putative [Archaeoglobus fulgidus DSM 8774]KUJ94776.1 MAG: Iron-sulfur cluster binding protein [Archaeoglobus fulgidus]KUK07215.1 MAG: Iron-sulfur cluster binding protein [Archaeoglobus fulgidus]
MEFHEIDRMAKKLGADIFGVADLDLLREYETFPENLLDSFDFGISIGVKLPDPLFDMLPDSRNLYSRYYVVANDMLDRIAFEISRAIESEGYEALPIPASKVLSDLHWRSYVSHKAIARAAGVGWVGRNLLLITPQFGPRVRLASVLTDMPLKAGKPARNRCGVCRECIDSCITQALRYSEFDDYPERDEVFEVDKCAAKLKEFASNPDIGTMVCGICIKVCPWGKLGNKTKGN